MKQRTKTKWQTSVSFGRGKKEGEKEGKERRKKIYRFGKGLFSCPPNFFPSPSILISRIGFRNTHYFLPYFFAGTFFNATIKEKKQTRFQTISKFLLLFAIFFFFKRFKKVDDRSVGFLHGNQKIKIIFYCQFIQRTNKSRN